MYLDGLFEYAYLSSFAMHSYGHNLGIYRNHL